MTGTAKTEESEFQKIYGLGVIPIPTNEPMIRIDQKDLIYRTESAKFDAVVADVVERHEEGQPILIGTASVAKSEVLSAQLKKAGVPHKVLNAKHHESEAAIIALAGRKGAVTVSTNMAGRGTDIMLGGNPEFLTELELREKGLDPVKDEEAYRLAWKNTLAKLEKQSTKEHDEVEELGGLYVIGSERHESRRIDNQLRGRSGRQGDPGESRFYLSLQDELMRLFKPEVIDRAMVTLKMPEDVPIESKWVSRQIEGAQKQVEAQNFEMRKNVLKYDDVMNRQRHAIYSDRRKVLEGADVQKELRATTDRVVEEGVRQYTDGFSEDWDLDELWSEMGKIYPVGIDKDEFEDCQDQDELVEAFVADAESAYDTRQEALGEDTMRELERQVLLTVLDRKWREHLYEMDYLREGIGLRAMAQRDPLVEYQREGGQMFNAMMDAFKEEVVGFLFNLDVEVPRSQQVGLVTNESGAAVTADSLVGAGSVAAGASARPGLSYSAADESGEVQERSGEDDEESTSDEKAEDSRPGGFKNVGRNQKCPCGSGKKFKHCHGRTAA
jgi:preprotein translocase subunit SecA